MNRSMLQDLNQRSREVLRQIVEANPLVERLESMLRRLIGEHITIQLKLSTGTGYLKRLRRAYLDHGLSISMFSVSSHNCSLFIHHSVSIQISISHCCRRRSPRPHSSHSAQ